MTDTSTRIEAQYNYENFGQPDIFGDAAAFKQVNPVGSVAPDFPVVRLRDLADVRLSDYLGKGFVVVEFGSVT
jgi:hypothetical protein